MKTDSGQVTFFFFSTWPDLSFKLEMKIDPNRSVYSELYKMNSSYLIDFFQNFQLQALNELESKDIPIILEDQYKQLIAENNLKNQCLICKLPCGEANKLGELKSFSIPSRDCKIIMRENKKTKILLDKHLTVHIEGDYKCEICSVWFTKNSLDFHQKRYHLELYEERISNGIKLTKEVWLSNRWREWRTHIISIFTALCWRQGKWSDDEDKEQQTSMWHLQGVCWWCGKDG